MPDDTSARISGIGIGPGDPELLSLKALRLIKEADIIFTPRAKISGESLARSIIEAAGITEGNFVEIEFPMVTGKTELEAKWGAAAESVADKIKKAASEKQAEIAAVFITIGDPGIYSTWTYLKNALADTAPHIKTETVAGIAAMNAAAAVLNNPLISGRDRLALVPMPKDLDELDSLTAGFETVVVYKVSNRLNEFCLKIEQLGLSDTTSLVQKTGQPEEQIYQRLSDIKPETNGYLSTAIIRCKQRDAEK